MSECFAGCGPPTNCGWTITTTPGTVFFNGVNVRMGAGFIGAGGQIFKSLLMPVPPTNRTLRVKFTTINAPQNSLIGYAAGIFDGTGLGSPAIDLFGDGVALVAVGLALYSGLWAPPVNAQRTAQVEVNALGIPTLRIDGVVVPLTPGLGSISYTPNVVVTSILNGNGTGFGSIDQLHAATGLVPYTLPFCCP